MDVVWEEIKDRHCLGKTPIGNMWIRFNRAGKASAMYTMFGSKVKYIPDQDWMKDKVGAQLELERLLGVEVFARKLTATTE